MVGVIEFLLTIPAVLYVDKFGRKSILLAGAIGMASCHFIVAGLVGSYEGNWQSHVAAGWVCIVFVWVSYILEGENIMTCVGVLSQSVQDTTVMCNEAQATDSSCKVEHTRPAKSWCLNPLTISE